MEQHFKRVHSTYVTETKVGTNFLGTKEYSCRSYFLRANNEEYDTTEFVASASSHGNSIDLKMTKYHAKRTTQLSFQLGKKDVEVLLQFIEAQKFKLKDFAGEFTEIKDDK